MQSFIRVAGQLGLLQKLFDSILYVAAKNLSSKNSLITPRIYGTVKMSIKR